MLPAQGGDYRLRVRAVLGRVHRLNLATRRILVIAKRSPFESSLQFGAGKGVDQSSGSRRTDKKTDVLGVVFGGDADYYQGVPVAT
jgi:hypothetical protein